MILYPENYTIPAEPERTDDGRDFDFAKAIIRYAVGNSDEPLHASQLIKIVSGHLSKETLKVLKPLRGNPVELSSMIASIGIPKVSTGLTEPERLDVIARAQGDGDIISSDRTKSLTRHEVLQCIRDVIEERSDTWTQA